MPTAKQHSPTTSRPRLSKKHLKVIHFNGDTLPPSDVPAMLERMWKEEVDILIYIGSRRRGSSVGKTHFGEDKYYHFWSGIAPGSSPKNYQEGVSIFVTVRFGLAQAVCQERPLSSRLLQLRIRHPDLDCVVTAAYAVPFSKTFGKDKKYKDAASYAKLRELFWHELQQAMDNWPCRSTHIVGIDANGTVRPGPGVGKLHPDPTIDFNGGQMMDLMRAFHLCAANTHRCDTFSHGTHYHAPTKRWRRIDYVLISDRLLSGDLLRHVGVRPVCGLATAKLDHLPITVELDVRLSSKYRSPYVPEVNVLNDLDTAKLNDKKLRAQYELAVSKDIAQYSHDRAIEALLSAEVLSTCEASFARANMLDSVTIRSRWLELIMQKHAAKFFAKPSGRDLRRSMAWNWQTDYDKETKELIFRAHVSAKEMQTAALAFGITQKNPNRVLQRIAAHDLGSPAGPRERARPPAGTGPPGPIHHLDLHNLLPDYAPIWDEHRQAPESSRTNIAELKALVIRAKEDQQAKKAAIRQCRINTVERITHEVLHAPSLKAKFQHARLIMCRKGAPCLGTAAYDEPEVEYNRLLEHLQEPPRSVTLVPTPTVHEELQRELAAQTVHAEVEAEHPLVLPDTEDTQLHILSDAVATSLGQEKPMKSCLRGTSPAVLLKSCAASIVPFLLHVFRLVCLLQYVPDSACDATTILLPKAGNQRKFSFRLICLLHRIWTTFAGVLANALRNTATTPGTRAYGALSTAFGFLPGCGTRHVLLLIREDRKSVV